MKATYTFTGLTEGQAKTLKQVIYDACFNLSIENIEIDGKKQAPCVIPDDMITPRRAVKELGK